MIPIELTEWAWRHGIPAHAIDELSLILGMASTHDASGSGSEARVQSEVRRDAPKHGMRLFRNNVGMLLNDRGVPVRFGLCNETKELNARFKSSDLIGWRRVEITQAMVGGVIAQVAALETKHAGWTYRGDPHEQAQARWIALVVADGGYGKFISDAGQL